VLSTEHDHAPRTAGLRNAVSIALTLIDGCGNNQTSAFESGEIRWLMYWHTVSDRAGPPATRDPARVNQDLVRVDQNQTTQADCVRADGLSVAPATQSQNLMSSLASGILARDRVHCIGPCRAGSRVS